MILYLLNKPLFQKHLHVPFFTTMQVYESGLKSFFIFSSNSCLLSYQFKVSKKIKSFVLIENKDFFPLKTEDFFPLILFENKVTWGHFRHVWIQGKSCAKKAKKSKFIVFRWGFLQPFSLSLHNPHAHGLLSIPDVKLDPHWPLNDTPLLTVINTSYLKLHKTLFG